MLKDGFSDKYWESFKKAIFYTFCGLVCFFLIMPNFIVVPISFSGARFLEFPPKSYSWQWYNNYFQTEEWVSATITSFEVAIIKDGENIERHESEIMGLPMLIKSIDI